jgi:hypothetical protein
MGAMEWLQTPLTVGLAALFAGLFTWLATRTQVKEAMKRERQRWRREVRAEPLRRLSRQLASMASCMKLQVRATQLQKARRKISPTLTGVTNQGQVGGTCVKVKINDHLLKLASPFCHGNASQETLSPL